MSLQDTLVQAHPIWTWIGFSLNLSHIILNKPQAVRRGETLLAAVSTESTIYSRTINNLPRKGSWHPSRAKKPLHLILSKGSLLQRLLSVNGRQLSFDSDSEIKYTERRYQSLSIGMYGEGLRGLGRTGSGERLSRQWGWPLHHMF